MLHLWWIDTPFLHFGIVIVCKNKGMQQIKFDWRYSLTTPIGATSTNFVVKRDLQNFGSTCRSLRMSFWRHDMKNTQHNLQVAKGIVEPKLQKRWPQLCRNLRRSLFWTNYVEFSWICVVIKCFDFAMNDRRWNVSNPPWEEWQFRTCFRTRSRSVNYERAGWTCSHDV